MKEIELTRGLKTLVDDDNFIELSKHKWYANENKLKSRTTYYAARTMKGIKMHRVIMDAKPGDILDHIDGNGLNNQKNNLRFCSKSQNNANSIKRESISGFRGVYRYYKFPLGKTWVVRMNINGKKKHFGNFTDKIEAAKVYDAEAKKAFGKFAKLNFPGENKC